MEEKDRAEAREFGAQIAREAESFEARIMRLPAGAGARRLTTWQQDARIKRFNAHGCGG